jgi:hypothetical protein
MKKLQFFLIIGWFSVFNVFSQSKPTTTGIKISANRSDYVLTNNEHIRCAMKSDFSFGGLINFPITEYFAFQTELSVNYKVSEINNQQTGRFSDCKFLSFEIPVYGIAKKKLKQGEIFAGAGLYMEAGFKAGTRDFNLYEEEVVKPLDLGATAMIGYELHNRMYLYTGGQRGIANLNNVSSSNFNVKSRTFFVGIAYKFKPAKEEQIRFNF